MKIKKFSGKGKRKRNEDLILRDKLRSGASLFLIVDGMGGYKRGDEAANIIAKEIYNSLFEITLINENRIQQAINEANTAISSFNKRHSIKSGATLGGLIYTKFESHIFWVGDVEVYHFRKKQILFQSKSHTLINDLSKNSIVNSESLERYKHIVTHSVSGNVERSEMGYNFQKMQKNDNFIICSDGVHDILSIQQILKMDADIQEMRGFLTEFAEDNYSLVFGQVQ